MSENILFNQGQSISSKYDFSKTYLSADIFKKKMDQALLRLRSFPKE